MKWRNQLLALFCLVIFGAVGVFYFQHWVVQKPFGIVLFVAEGLTPGTLATARRYGGGGEDTRLALDSMTHLALLATRSHDFAVPDQAAAATMLATGVKVNNGSVGVDGNGKPLRNIVELAREAGRATGLITNANLTDATPAAFYAHTLDQHNTEAVAQQLVERRQFDIVLGGGAVDFLPNTKGGRRHDARDLLLEVRRDGFDIVRSRSELEAIPGWKRPKVFGVFSEAEATGATTLRSTNSPSLADMVRRGIELLQFNTGGYVLIVDAALARKAAQQNDAERVLSETIELDRAVAMARRYVGRKSTILVTGDCGVGGLTLSGYPFLNDNGIALLGLNSAGDPWLSWATGPNGPRNYRAAKPNQSAETGLNEAELDRSREPAAMYSQPALNTAEDVVAAGVGPGADALQGFKENTAIFKIVADHL